MQSQRHKSKYLHLLKVPLLLRIQGKESMLSVLKPVQSSQETCWFPAFIFFTFLLEPSAAAALVIGFENFSQLAKTSSHFVWRNGTFYVVRKQIYRIIQLDSTCDKEYRQATLTSSSSLHLVTLGPEF